MHENYKNMGKDYYDHVEPGNKGVCGLLGFSPAVSAPLWDSSGSLFCFLMQERILCGPTM